MRKAYLFMVLLLVSACSKPPSTVLEGFALGTTYRIVLVGRAPEGVEKRIDSLMGALNASLSNFDDRSLLQRLNDNRTDTVDVWIADCIRIARTASELSGGAYDITVFPLVKALGFAGSDPQPDADRDSLLRLVGYDRIRVQGGRLVKADPNMQLDLKSVAKGYIVDCVAELIRTSGVENFLVEIGGEIRCRGTHPDGRCWRIGIDRPTEGNYIPGNDVQLLLRMTDRGLATSGNYRNFREEPDGRKVTHIIDPRTGASTASNLLSATVVAESSAWADALGTMFMALGLEKSRELLERHAELAVLLIYSDEEGAFRTYVSPAMEPYLIGTPQSATLKK